MKKPRAIFSLTGGLGNQLFQLAAALSYSAGEVGLEWGVGRPRLSSSGSPELMRFKLPKEVVVIEPGSFGKLLSKSSGYLLRMGFAPRWYEKFPPFRVLCHFLGSAISALYFKDFRKTIAVDDLGYSVIPYSGKKTFILGYFQSYLWASNTLIRNKLSSLTLLDGDGPELRNFRTLSQAERPLVIHVRLGDYKLEDDFGLLSPSYFLETAQRAVSEGNYSSIWIFSDEPDMAREYFSSLGNIQVRVIGEVDSSTSSTFEVMRLGYGYVISNSTFSWWAAFLSHNEKPAVYAPSPWFKGIKSPNQLIPSTWVVCDAIWSPRL